jgi:hypothetical protein
MMGAFGLLSQRHAPVCRMRFNIDDFEASTLEEFDISLLRLMLILACWMPFPAS